MKRLVLLLAVLSAVGGSAFGQGNLVAPKTVLSVVNGVTRPVANATITVCGPGATGIPCSPVLVGVLFSDAALTQPLPNPFTTDGNGNYQFAVAAGTYTVTETAPGLAGYSYQFSIGPSGGVLLNIANTWTAAQTHKADIVFDIASGANLKVNRSISTSTNTPLNGGSWILGPSDPVVNGCVSCIPSLSFLNLTANNGIPVMMMFKPNGSSGPDQVCDYLGCKLGFSTLVGAQQFGSGIAGNSDLLGELSFTGTTTATWVWVNAPGTPGQYTIHPECHVTPQFDYSTNRYWVSYSTNVSFTINFSGAVTGSVSYLCGYRN
jgi:hypothetical protein